MADGRRYRLDDLRHFATALASSAGLAPARASALASLLLWFDAAGAPSHGIATLGDVLEGVESGTIDPVAEPAVVLERGSTAVLDGRRGVPLLVLARAAGLATEKARDTGVGLVRVRNVGPTGSAAGVAAEMAIGPASALILGPGAAWAVALPAEGGLPAVFDPALGTGGVPDAAGVYPTLVAPWASVLNPDGGWLVAALAVNALEPLSTLHERVAEAIKGLDGSEGRLLPGPWERHRREVREHGVVMGPAAWESLARHAGRRGVTPPAPHA